MHIPTYEDLARTLLHPHVFLHSGYTLLGMAALADYLIAHSAQAQDTYSHGSHM